MIRSVASTRPPQSRTIAATKATNGTTTAPRLAIFWLVGMSLEAKQQDGRPLVGFQGSRGGFLVAFPQLHAPAAASERRRPASRAARGGRGDPRGDPRG